MAWESDSIEDSESHAIGFVSSITVRSEAGVPPACSGQHEYCMINKAGDTYRCLNRHRDL
jgi:hypothetical protein